jgi:hypothetical protein
VGESELMGESELVSEFKFGECKIQVIPVLQR